MGAVAWGLWPTPRFPSPLIKPCVRVSRTRLSDWLHRKANGAWSVELMSATTPRPVTAFALRYELSLTGPDRSRCLQAHRQSPSPRHLRKRTRSQGPLLRRRYPGLDAHTTLSDTRQWPPPVAMLRPLPSPTTGLPRLPKPPFRRAVHYPGGSSGCACRWLPRPCSLPQMAGGSASALSLSRPAQASLVLRPARSLSRPRRPLSRGSSPVSYPTKLLASFRTYRQLSG
jgi:hypothetical protein